MYYRLLLAAAQFSVTFRLYERWAEQRRGHHCHWSPHLVATVYTAQGDSADCHSTSKLSVTLIYINELFGINVMDTTVYKSRY